MGVSQEAEVERGGGERAEVARRSSGDRAEVERRSSGGRAEVAPLLGGARLVRAEEPPGVAPRAQQRPHLEVPRVVTADLGRRALPKQRVEVPGPRAQPGRVARAAARAAAA